MAETHTFEIALRNDAGDWVLDRADEVRTTLDREPDAIARAILEDWIIDHPGDLAGGLRLEVFGEDPYDYPPDDRTPIRVWVFVGTSDDHPAEPAAAAYLVAEPDDAEDADESDLSLSG